MEPSPTRKALSLRTCRNFLGIPPRKSWHNASHDQDVVTRLVLAFKQWRDAAVVVSRLNGQVSLMLVMPVLGTMGSGQPWAWTEPQRGPTLRRSGSRTRTIPASVTVHPLVVIRNSNTVEQRVLVFRQGRPA